MFTFPIPEAVRSYIGEQLGPLLGDEQFQEIVHFMTGYLPHQVPEVDKPRMGAVDCLALVYKGMSAVEKIRFLLGSTDPSKAEPGSVRREFGSDVMVNAAHASDSPENAVRELRIVSVDEDTIKPWVSKYYGTE